MDSGVEEHERVDCQSPEEERKAGASAVASERESTMYQGQDVTKETTTTSSPDTDSPVMISVDASPNMTYMWLFPLPVVEIMSNLNLLLFFFLWVYAQEVGSGNASQKSDEDDFVKVDDLPLQLTVMCEVRKD